MCAGSPSYLAVWLVHAGSQPRSPPHLSLPAPCLPDQLRPASLVLAFLSACISRLPALLPTSQLGVLSPPSSLLPLVFSLASSFSAAFFDLMLDFHFLLPSPRWVYQHSLLFKSYSPVIIVCYKKRQSPVEITEVLVFHYSNCKSIITFQSVTYFLIQSFQGGA